MKELKACKWCYFYLVRFSNPRDVCSQPHSNLLPTLALQELLDLDADQRITSEQLKTYFQDSSTDAVASEDASVSNPADGDRESRMTCEVCRSSDEEQEEVATLTWDLDDDHEDRPSEEEVATLIWDLIWHLSGEPTTASLLAPATAREPCP